MRAPVRLRANHSDSDYKAARALKAIADDYSVAVLLLPPHPQSDRRRLPRHRKRHARVFRGHGRGPGARQTNTKQAILKLTGRDVEEAQLRGELDTSLGASQMLDGNASRLRLSNEASARIVSTVRTDKELGRKAIADQLGG